MCFGSKTSDPFAAARVKLPEPTPGPDVKPEANPELTQNPNPTTPEQPAARTTAASTGLSIPTV